MTLSQCPYCDHRCAAGAKFCSECGAPLHLKPCPKCGRVTEVHTPVCDGCGTLFAEDYQVADEPLHDVPLLNDQLFDVARMFEPAQQDEPLFGEAAAKKAQSAPELRFDVNSGHAGAGRLIESSTQALVTFPSRELNLTAATRRPLKPVIVWAVGAAALVAIAAVLVLRPSAIPESINGTAMPAVTPQPAADTRPEPAKVTEPSVPLTAPVGATTAATAAATTGPAAATTGTSAATTGTSTATTGAAATVTSIVSSPVTATLPTVNAESKPPTDQTACAATLAALGLCPKP